MQGVYQLHKHKPQIIHADLKSPNLVCDGHWRVKVTDFNLSRIMGDHVTRLRRWWPTTRAGRRPKSSPVTPSRSSSDVFSFGSGESSLSPP